jgi:IclR family acetate operon transcriptional repressor
VAQPAESILASGETLRTLEKGLIVLEEVASVGYQGVSLAGLARRLGLHRTTLNRFLVTLVRCGYIEQVESTEHYRLGFKALALASATITGLPLRDIGAPLLEELNRTTRETVHIVVLDQGEVVTIDRLEAEHPITLRTYVGARRPAYCSATGKAMLAFLPDAVVDEILGRGMAARTANTITTPLRYKAQLQEARVRGYAVDDEEFVEGMRCVAAPVFDLTGRVVGAISLSAPTMRIDRERLTGLAVRVAEVARRLSRQLGYRASMNDSYASGGV